jgi:hypothetical protein
VEGRERERERREIERRGVRRLKINVRVVCCSSAERGEVDKGLPVNLSSMPFTADPALILVQDVCMVVAERRVLKKKKAEIHIRRG